MPFGCLPLILFLGFLFLLPMFFADMMMLAMSKLGFTPGASLLLVVGIFIGGMINIPVKQIKRRETIETDSSMYLGLERLFPKKSRPFDTVIALNLGGCIIPCIIVIYEMRLLGRIGFEALGLTLLSVVINIYLCYRFARPTPGRGITLPALVPALAAVFCAWIFLPASAPPAAFVAGVLGPLIGADLLHLKKMTQITGIASIGGAGTFDGIVLSGLMAALLA